DGDQQLEGRLVQELGLRKRIRGAESLEYRASFLRIHVSGDLNRWLLRVARGHVRSLPPRPAPSKVARAQRPPQAGARANDRPRGLSSRGAPRTADVRPGRLPGSTPVAP